MDVLWEIYMYNGEMIVGICQTRSDKLDSEYCEINH